MRILFLKSLLVTTLCATLLFPILAHGEAESKKSAENTSFCAEFVRSMLSCLKKDLACDDIPRNNAALAYCNKLAFDPFTRLVVDYYVENNYSPIPRRLLCNSPDIYARYSEIILKKALAQSDAILVSKYCSNPHIHEFKKLYARLDNSTRGRAVLGFARRNLDKEFVSFCHFLSREGKNSTIRSFASLALVINGCKDVELLRGVLIDPHTKSPHILNSLFEVIDSGWQEYFGEILEKSLLEVDNNQLWFQHVLRLLLSHYPTTDLSAFFAKAKYLSADLDVPLSHWLIANNFPKLPVRRFVKQFVDRLFSSKRKSSGYLPVNLIVVFNSLTSSSTKALKSLTEEQFELLDKKLVSYLFRSFKSPVISTANLPLNIPSSMWKQAVNEIETGNLLFSPAELKGLLILALRSVFLRYSDLQRLLELSEPVLEEEDFKEIIAAKDSRVQELLSGLFPQAGWVWESVGKKKVLQIYSKNPEAAKYLRFRFLHASEIWLEEFLPQEELFSGWRNFTPTNFGILKLLKRHPKKISTMLDSLLSNCSFSSLAKKTSFERIYGKIEKTYSGGSYKLFDFGFGIILAADFSDEYLLPVFMAKGVFTVERVVFTDDSLEIFATAEKKPSPEFKSISPEKWLATLLTPKLSSVDSDKDGLFDSCEPSMGLDPKNSDTDDDYIIDGADASPAIAAIPSLEPMSWIMTMKVGIQNPWSCLNVASGNLRNSENHFSIPVSVPIAIPFRQQAESGKQVTLPIFDIHKGTIRFFFTRFGVRYQILIGKDGIISCGIDVYE